MSTTFKAYAAPAKGAKLEPFEFDPGPLRDEQVEIQVEYCGICHSDLSMLDNEWGMTEYPFVPGHEVAGRVVAAGDKVKGVKVGQRVGLGWYAESCMSCPQCLSGNHNLCPTAEATMIKRPGGFANRVRCHWAWAVPLPDALDAKKSGPLFCGGITVFNPIIQCDVQPTDRVGVIGIGGLGHMALQFLNKWGCEVTAFTSSDSKRDEAMKFGAHHVVNSRDAAQLQKIAGSLNFILCTANAVAAVGCHHCQPGAQGPVAHRGRGARADSGGGVSVDCRAEGDFRLAAGQSVQHGPDAGIFRAAQHRADD